MTAAAQAVCTLFEGSYHLGVAVLANSLARAGFEGSLYAGYRGPLPPWAEATARPISLPLWKQAHVVPVTASMDLVLLAVDTPYHLTNYKPDFMLSLLAQPAAGVEALYYFDPDITVLAPWPFFLTWAHAGLAVCEDVNSPCAQHHPRRVAWRTYFGDQGFDLSFRQPDYANGGFVGVSRKHFAFLDTWRRIQEAMGATIGGLEKSAFRNSPMSPELLSPYHHFNRTDQDALNAAIEATEHPAAFLPKTAMGFAPGLAALPHALGSPKPWLKSYWRETLIRGKPPTGADKAYWNHADGPLQAWTADRLKRTQLEIRLCSALGRFYRGGDQP